MKETDKIQIKTKRNHAIFIWSTSFFLMYGEGRMDFIESIVWVIIFQYLLLDKIYFTAYLNTCPATEFHMCCYSTDLKVYHTHKSYQFIVTTFLLAFTTKSILKPSFHSKSKAAEISSTIFFLLLTHTNEKLKRKIRKHPMRNTYTSGLEGQISESNN